MAIRESVESITEIVQEYIKSLRQHQIEPELVYIFGSYAKGTSREYSDIDVAIVSNCLSGDRFDDGVRLMGFRWDIDLRIEPHPFRPEDFNEDNPEAAEIMRTGIRIIWQDLPDILRT
jgi:predicted nucleotidyltransferase